MQNHQVLRTSSTHLGKRLVEVLKNKGIQNQDVLRVMAGTPRDWFVEAGLTRRAYEDCALPIACGQTISQPYIVALMTEALLAEGPLRKVLEVGTGSGYQTAVLAPLVEELYSVEVLRDLLTKAQSRLRRLDVDNVSYLHGDGSQGWPEKAPFDGIIVTAAAREIPQTLMRQLVDGGRMVVPVGEKNGAQELLLITHENDRFDFQALCPVRFVPLVRTNDHG